jgi:hypothetical protein
MIYDYLNNYFVVEDIDYGVVVSRWGRGSGVFSTSVRRSLLLNVMSGAVLPPLQIEFFLKMSTILILGDI